MDRYIGRTLDNRYEILEIIGSGGMAVVYKARCHQLDRLVAVKILKDENLEDEDFCRRFHAEGQAVARLNHPNIVSVYDASDTDDGDYIVMELIDGITLKQYMEKRGVLDARETVHFAIQIARALEHAHSCGLVHRDIKPHNVMVLKNGTAKVTDFGIARMMESNNTQTKEALGSVHYISPEQAKGGRVDNRSDIYSLGVVMYEMITGRTPYDGETPVAVAIEHINGGAPRPSSINPSIPKGLEQIIMKAMAHDLQDRYISATALLEDLEAFRKNPDIKFHTVELPVVNEPRSALHLHGVKPTERDDVPAASTERPPRQEATWDKDKTDMLDGRKKDKTTTIAVILCSVLAIVAIIVLMILLTDEDYFSLETPATSSAQTLSSEPPTRTSALQLSAAPTQGKEPTYAPSLPTARETRVQAASTAAREADMPTLVGLEREQAEQLLLACGFSDVTWIEQLEMLPAGTVIGQSVEPGSRTALSAPLRITCAAGATTLSCTFDIPIRTQAYYLSIFLDGRPVLGEMRIEPYHATVSVSLSGRGKQQCSLYVDGKLYHTITVDFDANAEG